MQGKATRHGGGPPPGSAAPRAECRRHHLEPGAAELQELAAEVEHAVYWAGPQEAEALECLTLEEGPVYVRYLTDDAEPGDPRPAFLTVGTYPVGDGLAAILATGRRPRTETFEVPGGGTGLVSEDAPNSVYLAYPDSELQIEVYDPSPERARALVEDGKMSPIP